jgi:hypothetical protein
MAVRRGNVVRLAKSYGGRDTMRTVGEIASLARALEREHGEKPILVVDDAGVGGGVTDRLRELGEFYVEDFNAARSARHPADYPNRRSESWFDLADALPLIDLDADEDLAADLLAPRYSIDSQGRRVVEPKADTKRRLRRSPDRADAVVMALSIEPPGKRAQYMTMIIPSGQIRQRRFLDVADPYAGADARGDMGRARLDELRRQAGVPISTRWRPDIRS